MIGWLHKFSIPRPTGQGMRTAALFLGAPLFGGLLAWQLYGLEPERVCKTSFDMAHVDILRAFESCVGLYARSLDIKDHAIIGLLVILGLGYLMMMMRELRMQGEISGPLGWGGKFRSDDGKEPPAPTVTTTDHDVANRVSDLRAPRLPRAALLFPSGRDR